MLELMKFVAELAERVGYAEAKLEEAEALIDAMEDALCEDEDGEAGEDGDESPIAVLIALDGSVYVRSE